MNDDIITLTGVVGTEPELKIIAGGVTVVTFRVGSSQRRFDRRTGSWIETGTNWYTVSAFRRLADHVHRSIHKGERVILTGKLRLRSWENDVKQGMAADIDLDTIGHDLFWGTSTFQKAAAASRPTGEAAVDQPIEQWAVAQPGSQPDPSATPDAVGERPAATSPVSWSVPNAGVDTRELVAAQGDTPF